MQKTTLSRCGMLVAPHHLAAQAGRDILAEGGNAVEAMVAAAATIAVVYPHMNSIGGDGFWLIKEPGQPPLAIDACGGAAQQANLDFYQGHKKIPTRGPKAALTVAGTVQGWQTALTISARWGRPLPLNRLLENAQWHARQGVPLSPSLHDVIAEKHQTLAQAPGFAEIFLRQGKCPSYPSLLQQPELADSLAQLAKAGLGDFYRGDLAQTLANGLTNAGSPLRLTDLNQYQAQQVKPLQVRLPQAWLYNLPPPTQGLASLMILGSFAKLGVRQAESFAHLHGLIEATKLAFRLRDQYITDPAYLNRGYSNHGHSNQPPQALLSDAALADCAQTIHPNRAANWPSAGPPGDTVWLGAIDKQGRAVSFIQSTYWEFGSGFIVPHTGILWQNRGISFSLNPQDLQYLQPGRKPFHTLNPAMALFDDGRLMSYGCMGGEGQPQTQAAIFSRYAMFNQPLQQAISAPRWLLGRTWGDDSSSLKLERGFSPELIAQLQQAGHRVELLAEDYSQHMGHAGALVRHPQGIIEGAYDPRSDGAAAAL